MHKQIALVLATLAGPLLASQEAIRFAGPASIRPLADVLASAGEKIPDLTIPHQWDIWIRQHDAEMRGRIDRTLEDSISVLIAFGASFTSLPKLGAVTEAISPAGDLTPAARARVDAFLEALDRMDNERFRLVLQFLRRRQITQEELPAFLNGNLRRTAVEWPRDHRNGGFLSDSAIEAALRTLRDRGEAPAKIRHIGVIGPGLDPDYDPDAYNLSAGLEATSRLNLVKPANVDLTLLDINPWVLSHFRAIAAKAGARSGARLRAEDLNVVTQNLESGFDLVVADPALAGYSRLDQVLALANIAQMMTSGAILLVNGGPPAIVPPELEPLAGGEAKEIAAYRRRPR